MMPRVLAVRSAFPEHRLAQAEITQAFASRGKLGPAEWALTERLHGSAEVDTRHIVLPVEECVHLHGAEEVNDRYIPEATMLGGSDPSGGAFVEAEDDPPSTTHPVADPSKFTDVSISFATGVSCRLGGGTDDADRLIRSASPRFVLTFCVDGLGSSKLNAMAPSLTPPAR